jgi:hypothetical protein
VDSENREYGRLQLQPEVKGGRILDYRTVFNVLLEYQNRMFVCPTAMVRASVYREVGNYDQARFFNSSDLEMWLRIAQKHRLAILDEYLIRYRHFDGQSSRRYHKMRTEVGRFFTIMDLFLENGSAEIATLNALRAYEGHRAEDFLMITVNHYILDSMAEAASTLSKIKLKSLLLGRRIQRLRMLSLYLLLSVLVRMPHNTAWANIFYNRWQVKDSSTIRVKVLTLFTWFNHRQRIVRFPQTREAKINNESAERHISLH